MTRWLVDGMNVIGSVPDRWWEDREGAMRRLVEELERHARTSGDDVTVVFDALPFDLPRGAVEVLFAPGGPNAADDAIVRLMEDARRPGELTVVTSDRRLDERVRALGADVAGAGWFRRILAG